MNIDSNTTEAVEAELRLLTIEVMQFTINQMDLGAKYNRFSFQIKNELKIDESKKQVAILVHVELKNEDQTSTLATISLLNLFEIINFESTIQFERTGKMKVPKQLVEILLNQSIATTRGVLYSHLKGTYLQAALLPMIQLNQI